MIDEKTIEQIKARLCVRDPLRAVPVASTVNVLDLIQLLLQFWQACPSPKGWWIPMKTSSLLCVGMLAIAGLMCNTAHATFHLMQIEQVIGGVDGDTTKQRQVRGPSQGLSRRHFELPA